MYVVFESCEGGYIEMIFEYVQIKLYFHDCFFLQLKTEGYYSKVQVSYSFFKILTFDLAVYIFVEIYKGNMCRWFLGGVGRGGGWE